MRSADPSSTNANNSEAVPFTGLKMTPRHHVAKKCLVKLNNKVLVRDVNLI